MEEVFLRVGAGEETLFPANNVQKSGNVIAVGTTRGPAVDSARRGIAALVIRLRPNEERTSHFLFHETGNDAFSSLQEEARSLIAGLPLYRGDPLRVDAEGALAVEALDGFPAAEAEDWHGERIADALRRALLLGGAVLLPAGAGAPFLLSGLFWRAMVRGSFQGGLYVLDSVRKAAAAGRLRELLHTA